jgi:hypothetical protein
MLAAALCTACADEDFTASPTDSGEAVSLTSTKLHVITRAGDEIETFYPGTAYRLFAVQHAAQEADYKWSADIKSDGDAAIMYGMTGRESEDHDIVYNDGVNFNYATGSNADCLDFFAITVDNVDKDHHFEEKLPEFDSLARVNGVSPTVEWKVGQCSAVSTQPGDLMFSNDQKQKSYQDGAVTLNFRHALTRFTFQAAVQDESDYSDKWLADNVTLTGIEVHGTHYAGTFNICTGTWSYTTGSNTEIAACDTEKLGQKLTTSAKDVGEPLLIFPNNDEVLEMVVKLHFDSKPANQDFSSNEKRVSWSDADGGGYDVTVTTPLTLGEVENVTDAAQKDKAVEFASNYSYLFSIVVMRNDVRVLAIVPTVYDWIDDELTYETVLGQPVTFGGLMWMDRNLGASTWDAENDFYGSIGYYYQYGRNIPYILDPEKFEYYVCDDNVTSLNKGSGSDQYGVCVVMSTSADFKVSDYKKSTYWKSPYYSWFLRDRIKDVDEEVKKKLDDYQVSCIYTYDHQGKKVSGHHLLESTEVCPIQNVGDVILNDDNTTVNDDLTSEYYKFSVLDRGGTNIYYQWTYGKSGDYEMKYWYNSPETQPCPKGWRLPTREDLYAFMPWTGTSNEITWSAHGSVYQMNDDGTTTNRGTLIHYWDFAKEYGYDENIKFVDQYGKSYWLGDGSKGWWYSTTAGSAQGKLYGLTQEIRFGQIKTVADDGTESFKNVAYILNGRGTSSAYRIKIETHFSKGSLNKRYITISRYDADYNQDHGIDYYVQDDEMRETAWATPIETIRYPCAGFIVTNYDYFDLRSFGDGAVLRTSETGAAGKTGMSYVQYLTTATFSVAVHESRVSLGDQIRCCRDITASKN